MMTTNALSGDEGTPAWGGGHIGPPLPHLGNVHRMVLCHLNYPLVKKKTKLKFFRLIKFNFEK